MTCDEDCPYASMVPVGRNETASVYAMWAISTAMANGVVPVDIKHRCAIKGACPRGMR